MAMKNLYKALLISLLASCQINSDATRQKAVSQKLTVEYSGDADVVQFRMFEGLSQTLKKNASTGVFEGSLEIPDLNEAIFTYDLIVHKTDSSGDMLELEPISHLIKLNQNDAIEKKKGFLWIGKNRKNDYLKNEALTGSLTTERIKSQFLGEERAVTIYTPKDGDSKTPHIYFTDGQVVSEYAPYIDRLISTKKIKPVKLIGIHASSHNRYQEYVRGGKDNILFKKHEDFVFEEVIPGIEKGIANREGKRYLYGFSNGAAFCMHAGLNHPDVFEEIIAFSTADYISSMARMMNPITFNFREYPEFYMGAGRYETSIYEANVKFLDKMKDNAIRVKFKEFVSGHDYNVWRIEFLAYLESRFKK